MVAEFGGGEEAGGVSAGFIMREGRRTMLGLTSCVDVGEAAEAGEPALADMAADVLEIPYGRGGPVNDAETGPSLSAPQSDKVRSREIAGMGGVSRLVQRTFDRWEL